MACYWPCDKKYPTVRQRNSIFYHFHHLPFGVIAGQYWDPMSRGAPANIFCLTGFFISAGLSFPLAFSGHTVSKKVRVIKWFVKINVTAIPIRRPAGTRTSMHKLFKKFLINSVLFCPEKLLDAPQGWVISFCLPAFRFPLLQWLHCVFMLLSLKTNLFQGSKLINDWHHCKHWAYSNKKRCLQCSQWSSSITFTCLLVASFMLKISLMKPCYLEIHSCLLTWI